MNVPSEAGISQPELITVRRNSLTQSYSSTIFERLLEEWQIHLYHSAPAELRSFVVPSDEAAEWRTASMQSLAKYWDTPEEDAAWADL